MAIEFEVSDMDVVRAALFDALASGLDLSDGKVEVHEGLKVRKHQEF